MIIIFYITLQLLFGVNSHSFVSSNLSTIIIFLYFFTYKTYKIYINRNLLNIFHKNIYTKLSILVFTIIFFFMLYISFIEYLNFILWVYFKFDSYVYIRVNLIFFITLICIFFKFNLFSSYLNINFSQHLTTHLLIYLFIITIFNYSFINNTSSFFISDFISLRPLLVILDNTFMEILSIFDTYYKYSEKPFMLIFSFYIKFFYYIEIYSFVDNFFNFYISFFNYNLIYIFLIYIHIFKFLNITYFTKLVFFL